jgi:agmatinase
MAGGLRVPDNFLALEEAYSTFDAARVLILPVPLEATVSYGGGTAAGPRAIIEASQQVELYDREHDRECALEYGVHTLPAVNLAGLPPPAAVEWIAAAVAEAASSGKLVVALGGEHTISAGVSRGLLDALGGPLTVVQLDAHSDLRDSYDGTPYSHACVARRMLEDDRVEQVLQLGVRSVDLEEVEFAHAHAQRLRVWYAEDVHDGRWLEEFVERVRGRRVHLTIDVDGLDPAIMPATGTPEPGGLSWHETLKLLRRVIERRTVVGCDLVELSPMAGNVAPNFLCAKLIYKILSYRFGSEVAANR